MKIPPCPECGQKYKEVPNKKKEWNSHWKRVTIGVVNAWTMEDGHHIRFNCTKCGHEWTIKIKQKK